ncbi:hypothetical protein FOS14_18690 [Skermania sp. ID1734]|uniref:DUF5313 family protein n=1 Tax=Skermania sp. ID1734 TaxID=2597516 RepID=UPI00117E4B16|nr:DUF5313 family protein [Skermania sp. ID1734]TSD95383.1 hypothetical protein FOS14_18690 [Skermania sp. ID1734]
MTQAASPRPGFLAYLGYCAGRRLPKSMTGWVRNDLAGRGAAARMVTRAAVPCIILLIPLALVPASLDVRATMTLPILIPYIYFSIALNKVYRRHRLAQHGLNPDLVEEIPRQREAARRREYEERHGPRH